MIMVRQHSDDNEKSPYTSASYSRGQDRVIALSVDFESARDKIEKCIDNVPVLKNRAVRRYVTAEDIASLL